MGPPGVGKGTQARYLTRDQGLVHISTGDMLRLAVTTGTPLGRKVAKVMTTGELVSDDLMMELVRERIQQPDAAGGWLLDGFPRTEAQAEGLAEMLGQIGQTIDTVLIIMAPNEVIIDRLTSRVTCRVCGKIMHRKELSPDRPGACPACGAEKDPVTDGPAVFHRDDDKERTIRRRLDVFAQQTLAAAGILEKRFRSVRIQGTGTPDEVAAEVADALE